MNIRTLAVGFGLGLATALFAGHALSQDGAPPSAPDAPPGGPPDMPSPEEMIAMMEKWKESMQPGPQHEFLKSTSGSWETTTRIWWGGPGTEATVTSGTAELKSVLDGRFVLQESQSQFPMPNPETGEFESIPHLGYGITGYDRVRNVYVGAWIDNMNTQILTMKGSLDPGGKTLNMYGEMDEPMLGIYGRTVKYVTRIVDENTHVFEIIDLHAGDAYKVVEVTYKRKVDGG